MILRLTGVCMIIVSCGSLGFLIARAGYQERQAIRQWITALDYMQCELQYRLTALPELCRQAAAQSNGVINCLLAHLAMELDNQMESDVKQCMVNAVASVPDLPDRVSAKALELGNTLGRFDCDGQIRHLQLAREQGRRELELLEKDSANRTRCYQTLGICAGAAVAILLI